MPLSLAAILAASTAFSCSWAADVSVVLGLPVFMVVGILGVLALGISAIARQRVMPLTLVEAMLAIFWVWTAASVLWSLEPVLSLVQVCYYLAVFGMFVLVLRVCADTHNWRLIGWAYVAGCFVAAVIVTANSGGFAEGTLGIERATVGDINANYIAYSIATSLPIVIALVTVHPSRLWVKSVGVGYFVIALAAITFTGCRGAAIAAVLCLSVWFWRHNRRNGLALFAVALLGLGCFTLIDYLPDLPDARINLFLALKASNSEVDWSRRLEVWPLALEYFSRNPIGGIGASAFMAANPYGMRVHNVALTMATETGIVGFFLYFGVVVMIFYRIVGQADNRAVRNAGLCLLVTWLPIAASGVWEGSPVAWISFGWLLAAASRPTRRTQRSMPAAVCFSGSNHDKVASSSMRQPTLVSNCIILQ